MVNFPRFFHRCLNIIPLAGLFFCSCERDDATEQLPGTAQAVQVVQVEVGFAETRAFANGQGHRVNRILLLPFRKSAENLTDDNANFVPAYNLASQINVNQFPANSAKLHLQSGTTYKVMVIGYNQSDFDFTNQTNPTNRFDIGSVTTPTTLANFHLSLKSAVVVPEFFTCIAQAYLGAVPQGTAFRPEQGYTLQGTLVRLVSGLSITITQVPSFVQSITLRAENLVKSSLATTAAATQWQITGDGANRTLDKQTPVNGTVTISVFLLPTFATYKTGLYLDVAFGSTSGTYTVKSPDGAVVSSNRFIFNPNQAINLTGDYTVAINYGFTISRDINLDDDKWDGIQ